MAIHAGGQAGFSDVVTKGEAYAFPPTKTFPGLRTNDAMAGLLARRSMLLAAFPEPEGSSDMIGHQLLADSCGYSAGFTPASLLAPDQGSTIWRF